MITIYCITNLKTGDKYVGQTHKTAEERLRKHWRARYENKRGRLVDQMLEYDFEDYKIEVLEEVSLGDEREAYWINKLNTIEAGLNTVMPNGFGKLTLSRMNTTKKTQGVRGIYCYTLDGEYVAYYNSIRDAEEALFPGEIHKQGRTAFLSQCAKGHKSKAYGYKWSYEPLV